MDKYWVKAYSMCKHVEPSAASIAAALRECAAEAEERARRAEKLIAVLKKTPYTLSGPNGAETLAAWEKYNER